RRGRRLLQLARELLGEDEPADAQAGRDRLREGRAVGDAALRELEQRRRRLALEANQAVGVVLEDEKVVLGCELDDATPALGRERPTARILERRDRVEERRRLAVAQRRLE